MYPIARENGAGLRNSARAVSRLSAQQASAYYLVLFKTRYLRDEKNDRIIFLSSDSSEKNAQKLRTY